MIDLLDQHPANVVEASTSADVVAAVASARDQGRPLAVYATGHGTHAPADGALVLETSRMAEVMVDPHRRIARVGPGARWSQVIEADAPFGLAPLSGTHASVGVTGYTVGGGLSWLSRLHGFAADSVLRAQVVTADGRLLTATADRNPDLFWALRGGGGNFGVVTSLEFRLYPVERVFAGTALFPIERAKYVLAHYREWALDQPRELTTSVVLMRNAPGNAVIGPVLGIRGLYAGGCDAALRALDPLRRIAGAPIADGFRGTTYAGAGGVGGTAPRHFEMYEALPDPLVDELVEAVTRPDAPADAVEVRHWGGAMAAAGDHAGPTGHREVPFSITVDGPVESAAPVALYSTGGSFLNFLRDPRMTHIAYTPANYVRLRDVKRAYDPENVFGTGHNIPPSGWTARELHPAAA